MCLKKVIDEPKMLHKIMCRLDMIKRATHIMQNSVLLKLHYFTVKECKNKFTQPAGSSAPLQKSKHITSTPWHP